MIVVLLMRCVSPVLVKAPDWLQARGTRFIEVPCGKCPACLSRRRDDWCYRLANEWRNSKSALFITMTYADENLPISPDTGFPTTRIAEVSQWMKLLRRAIDLKCPKDYPLKKWREDNKLKYFAVSEYGGDTERPHYHVILFNLDFNFLSLLVDTWKHGTVEIGVLTPRRITYCCKYCLDLSKQDRESYDRQEQETPRMLCSKSLGKNLLHNVQYTSYVRNRADGSYCNEQGISRPLPRYYRERIFNEEERHQIYRKNVIRNETLLEEFLANSGHCRIEGVAEFTRQEEGKVSTYLRQIKKSVNRKHIDKFNKKLNNRAYVDFLKNSLAQSKEKHS